MMKNWKLFFLIIGISLNAFQVRAHEMEGTDTTPALPLAGRPLRQVDFKRDLKDLAHSEPSILSWTDDDALQYIRRRTNDINRRITEMNLFLSRQRELDPVKAAKGAFKEYDSIWKNTLSYPSVLDYIAIRIAKSKERGAADIVELQSAFKAASASFAIMGPESIEARKVFKNACQP